MNNKILKTPFIELHITEDGPINFQEFMSRNMHQIYLVFIDAFSEIIKSNLDSKLRLTIKVNNIFDNAFVSNFYLGTEDITLLQNTLLPYFLEREEFEICERINKLIDQLQKMGNH